MVRFNLAIARSCFVKCRGCYNHFSDQRDLVSPVDIGAFLDYCNQRVPITKVTLCGGDPLSRPDIVTLVRSIAELGIPAKLDTVGSAFLGRQKLRFFGAGTVEYVDPESILPYVQAVAIPLDGASQESVQLFREGRSLLFEETLEILGIITRFGTPVGVNTVVHQGNVHDLANILEVLKRFEIREWQMFEYRPSGPLSFKNRDEFALAPGRFPEITAPFVAQSGTLLHPSKITAKGAREILPSRLVVDSHGLAWSHLEWVEEPLPEPGPRRNVVGNIQNPDDYDRIIEAAKACMEGRVRTEGAAAAGL